MKSRQALDLFSAFICGGFFVALLLLRTEIKRIIVVEETTEGEGATQTVKSTSRPSLRVEPKPMTA